MSIEQELELYENIYNQMLKVPEYYQSRCFTDYKLELEMRIFNLKDNLEHIKQFKK